MLYLAVVVHALIVSIQRVLDLTTSSAYEGRVDLEAIFEVSSFLLLVEDRRQTGVVGGAPSTRRTATRHKRYLERFKVSNGSLDSLADRDVLYLDMVVDTTVVLTLLATEVALIMPVQEIATWAPLRILKQLMKQHHVHINGRNVHVNDRAYALQTHICSDRCKCTVLVFIRPIVSRVHPYEGKSQYSSQRANQATLEIRTDEELVEHSCESSKSEWVFPPDGFSKRHKLRIVQRWCAAITQEALQEEPCGVCGQLTVSKLLEHVPIDHPMMSILMERAPYVTRGSAEPKGVHVLCSAGMQNHGNVKTVSVCTSCLQSLQRHKIPNESLANGLWTGDVPKELARLEFAEKLLVSRYRHNVCVVQVENGGQRKMRANAIVFSQPIQEFRKVLPPPRTELEEILAILFTGPCKPTEAEFKRTPLLVRRNVLNDALQWLQRNHPDYKDLVISQTNICSYPESEPPVAVMYRPTDGEPAAEDMPVYDEMPAYGPVDGPCSFAVHGVTAETFSEMSYGNRVLRALDHFNKERGKVLAYGHASLPESVFHNPGLYPSLFPWLFPYGMGSIGNNFISKRISWKRHVKALLLYHDRRFQVDEYFAFILFNQLQIRSSSRGGFLLTDRKNFHHVCEKLLMLDPNALSSLIKRSKRDGYTKPVTLAERACYELLTHIDHVAGHVPGSNTQRKYQRNEIRSMIIELGVPIFFITFAPADLNSPICLYYCGVKMSLDEPLSSMPVYLKRRRMVANNPVACARFFHLTVTLFLRYILGVGTEDIGLYGKTKAYYGTVEQQGRMTLHLHLLLWIASSLSPLEMRERILTNDEFRQRLIEWLESCFQGEFSNGSMQDVKERIYRKRNGEQSDVWNPDTVSREDVDLSDTADEPMFDTTYNPVLDIPRAPSEDLGSASDEQIDTWFRQMCDITDEVVFLSNRHSPYHNKGCLKGKDAYCRARFPRDFIEQTTVDPETGWIQMKKLEVWINTFSVVLSYVLRCNSDVTCLLSGTQVRAVVAYVADYITKGSLKTHTIFEAIRTVIDNAAEYLTKSASRERAARAMLVKIVNILTSKMQVGGPMVCAYLLGQPDHYTGHTFKTVYWYPYVHIVSKSWGEIDIDVAHESRIVLLEGNVDGVFERKKTNDYVHRPDKFERMCLYDYLQQTYVSRVAPGDASKDVFTDDCDDDILSDDESIQEPAYIETNAMPNRDDKARVRFQHEHPAYRTHVVHKRTNVADYPIINFVGGLLPRRDKGDREEYCKTMMVLFAPDGWRTGKELKRTEESWSSAFDRTLFSDRQEQLMKNMNLLYECKDARDDYAALRRAKKDSGSIVGPFSTEDIDEMDANALTEQIIEDIVTVDPTVYIDDDNTYGPTTLKKRMIMEDTKQFLTKLVEQGVQRFGKRSVIDHGLSNLANTVEYQSPYTWKKIVEAARNEVLENKFKNAPRAPPAPKKRRKNKGLDTGVHIVDKERIDLHSQPPDLSGVDQSLLQTKQTEMANRGVPNDDVSLIARLVLAHTLNEEQTRAFVTATKKLMQNTPDKLVLYIGGMGGTGKTTVLRALVHFFSERQETHRFIVLAPTGSAASVVDGSTYHSMLGLGRDNDSNRYGIPRARRRLENVNTVFIDEVSMVSCLEMYRICEQMCTVFGEPDLLFGGCHIIFAGDFAQMPPAVGQASLYSSTVSFGLASEQDIEQAALGKSIWHQVIEVVILTENMRQKGQSDGDKMFRVALENMRYASCTPVDIDLLSSRISSIEDGMPHIGDPRFKYVSVIVGRNTMKDVFNDVMSTDYAIENGRELSPFYSIDKWSGSTNGSRSERTRTSVKRIVNPRRNTEYVREDIQRTIWTLPPLSTEQVPGILKLCLDIPVMLKNNIATELCATNGAEGRVVGWTCKPVSTGLPVLSTLYVLLSSPPRDVQLPGLPRNVIPVTPTIRRILCDMPLDEHVRISREQVPVVPNFAMTDYVCQGRTRVYNVVDLRAARSHQSIYTSLSRSSSLEGTLILTSFDTSKITAGIPADLAREFRELEILNDINRLKYHGQLPERIAGCTRSELVQRYQHWKGIRHVPEGVHPSLNWANLPDIVLQPPPVPLKWRVLQRTTRGPKNGKRVHEPDQVSSKSNSKRRKTQPECSERQDDDRVDVPSAGEASTVRTNPDLEQKSAQTAYLGRLEPSLSTLSINTTPSQAAYLATGVSWDSRNWSCAYDVCIFLLWNLFKEYGSSNVESWFPQNTQAEYLWKGFKDVERGGQTLEQVRDGIRDRLSELQPDRFPRIGHIPTSLTDVLVELLSPAHPYMHQVCACKKCGFAYLNNMSAYRSLVWCTCGLQDNCSDNSLCRMSSQDAIAAFLAQSSVGMCQACSRTTVQNISWEVSRLPAVFFVETPFEPGGTALIDPSRHVSIKTASATASYDLNGVFYYGDNHFVARYIDRSSGMWFYDGAMTGTRCLFEPNTDVSLLHRNGRNACILVYRKRL